MTEFLYFPLQSPQAVLILGSREDLMDKIGHLAHFRLFHAPGSQGGGAETNTAGDFGRSLIKGDAILVYGNAGQIQGFFGLLAGKADICKIHKKEMVIGATGDELVPMTQEFGGQGSGIAEGLDVDNV